MKEKNGNLPNENENLVSREEIVAGQKVQVSYDKSDTNFEKPKAITEPEGLEGAELENYHKEAENVIKMKRSASDKYDEAAIARKQLAEEKAKFEEEKEDWLKTKGTKIQTKQAASDINIEAPDFNKILAEKTGKQVNSDDDAADILIDDPAAYHAATKEFLRKNNESMATTFKKYSEAQNTSKLESTLFKQKIEGQGLNYGQVESFAKLRGFPMNDYTLQAFKFENKITDLTKDINKSIPDSIDIKWIPAGDVKAAGFKKSLTEEFPLHQDLAEYVRKERLKPIDKQDPRVVEMMSR